jgi:hypothetical protein
VNVHPLREAIGAHLGQVLTPEVATSIELAALAAARDSGERKVVEIAGGDEKSGGVLAVVTRIPGGYELESHKHDHGHLSVLANGTADVIVDGVCQRFTGPCHVTIPPGSKHEIHAVTDVVWYCLWAQDSAPTQAIADSIKVMESLEVEADHG